MLDFNIFVKTLRHVFADFIGVEELTIKELIPLPKKFQSVTAKMELTGDFPATLYLNVTQRGIEISMKKLDIAKGDEDRMLMDTVSELLNIVVGAAQRQSPVRYDFSLPTALKGENYPLQFSGHTTQKGYQFVYEDFEVILILDA
ncbi:MAG: hypothetical protein LDLANPLL_01272 [Turneriella sp.]|nr:hypothetical protein [Turneriella sp.]